VGVANEVRDNLDGRFHARHDNHVGRECLHVIASPVSSTNRLLSIRNAERPRAHISWP
jgi:hypothetical protein